MTPLSLLSNARVKVQFEGWSGRKVWLFSHGIVLVNLNLIEVTCVFNFSLKDNGNDRCNEGHDHPKNSSLLPANPERFTNHNLALYL